MATQQNIIREIYKKAILKAKKILFNSDGPVFNVFKKDYTKFALVSYLTAPFKIGNQFRHNNERATQEIAAVLDELGYTVDVINFSDKKTYSYEKYSLIIGFGDPFCNSFAKNSQAKRLYYSTGMEVASHNYAAITRLKEFYKRHHIWLTESARIVNETWSLQTQAVDGIITYGNETIKNSYRKYYDGPIFPLHNIRFQLRKTTDFLSKKKNWDEARKNFCLFPAAGLVHKGVDIVFELFSKHPDWQLHLGFPPTKEHRFFTIYKDILALPNIHYYGFVDMTKPEYTDILDTCAFFISPSASEGCPTSVINACANGKLIPIANKESGLEGGFEIPMKEISENELEKAIVQAQALSNNELEKRSLEAYRYFNSIHSLENYRKELKTAVSAILKDAV